MKTFNRSPFHRTAPSAKAPIRAEVPSVSDGDTVVLRIYAAIDSWGGDWGVSAQEFRAELDALPKTVKNIHLHINSPGGEVWEGLAILNAIRQSDAHVTAIVDGLAASAASFIAMGADEVVMAPNSELMIHNPLGLCVGDHTAMTRMAADLEREARNLAAIYQARAGGDLDAWLEAMAVETWYLADEAVKAGLADRVDTKEPPAKNDVKASYDLSIFAHSGRADGPRPYMPGPFSNSARADGPGDHKPPAEPADHQQEGADTMSDVIKKGIIDRLGIKDADLDDAQLLAAMDEALAERAEPAAPKNAAAFAAPEGTVLMDAAQLEQLRAQAAQGAEARARQVQDQRARIVDSAISEGRIAPARRDHWLAQLNADEEGATAVLNTLAAGTIPLAPAGFTGGVDESSDEDSKIYAKAWGKTEKKEA